MDSLILTRLTDFDEYQALVAFMLQRLNPANVFLLVDPAFGLTLHRILTQRLPSDAVVLLVTPTARPVVQLKHKRRCGPLNYPKI